MSVTPEQLIAFLGTRVLGASAAVVEPLRFPAPLAPGKSGALSFASREDAKTSGALNRTLSSAVLVQPSQLRDVPRGVCAIAVNDPRLEFARVCQKFFAPVRHVGIHPTAVIDASASLGMDLSIAAGVVIGANVTIGDGTQLGANCVIGDNCVLGREVKIGPGTVVGYSGFGYAREEDGTPVAVPHFGAVWIGDRVEIGANAAIDCGTLADTVLEEDSKVDNLVHIAHNCVVGKGSFVIASSVLCGGVSLGEASWVAPNAVVKEQLTIGAGAVVGLSATVLQAVPERAVVVGNPARQLRFPPR